MAERRMFSKTIIDSDMFLDMSLSTQALYFHLAMRADDDGFINNPRKIQRMVGCGNDELKMLIAKRFIIPFDSGVCVIKHWRIHNYIRIDRYKETTYIEEKNQLDLKENLAYTISKKNVGIPNGNQMDTIGIPSGNQMETQVRLGKDSIDIYSRIIDHLNLKTNSNFRATTTKTKRLIDARFNEGFTVENFLQVINVKTKEWLQDKSMKKYLRPETLFGTKFESYLNQAPESSEENKNSNSNYKPFEFD